MTDLSVMYSSKTDQWATPQSFFEELDAEFHFNLDPCADESNHKCAEYFTKEQNGLKQDWGGRATCSAIHHTVRLSEIGLQNVIRKAQKKIPLWCFFTGQNGHEVFSRLHIAPFRDSLCAEQAKVWRRQEQCAVPIYDCYI